MSVLYCTVPDRVKYSTVIADEYRKVTEKIDYWRADWGIYNMYTGSEYLTSCCFFLLLFFVLS